MAVAKRESKTAQALARRVREALGRVGAGGEPLLVAVSGGLDSMVLLAVLAELAPSRGIALAAGHVHHGLRDDDADADAASVRAAAGQLGVPYLERRVDPRAERATAGSSRRRATLQEAARWLRYRALAAMAAEVGARRVATAHHRDDQVETLLLRLLRGTSPQGLAGMRERSAWPARGARAERPALETLRPLLAVSRAEIREFARARGVSWREDPSNRDPHYTRNRLRHEWLPALREAFNPQLDRALADLAHAAAEEQAWLAELESVEVAARFERLGDHALRLGIQVGEVGKTLPVALARRLARRALEEMGAGREVTARHLERMLAFFDHARPGARLELPGALQLRLDSPDFRLERVPVPPVAEC